MLKKKALQIKLQEGEISEEQQIDIIRNAKLCSHEYGFVVHQFRALASAFSEEDYSVYDEACSIQGEEGNEEELKPRSKSKFDENNALRIIPNPNNGSFKITSDSENSKEIEIINAQGKIITSFIMDMRTYTVETKNLVAGVYFVKCNLGNDEVLIKKMIVY